MATGTVKSMEDCALSHLTYQTIVKLTDTYEDVDLEDIVEEMRNLFGPGLSKRVRKYVNKAVQNGVLIRIGDCYEPNPNVIPPYASASSQSDRVPSETLQNSQPGGGISQQFQAGGASQSYQHNETPQHFQLPGAPQYFQHFGMPQHLQPSGTPQHFQPVGIPQHYQTSGAPHQFQPRF